jgi:hypothetical protein
MVAGVGAAVANTETRSEDATVGNLRLRRGRVPGTSASLKSTC